MAIIENLHFCSFCRKVPKEVDTVIIAGPGGVNICETCVDLCTRIVDEARKRKSESCSHQKEEK